MKLISKLKLEAPLYEFFHQLFLTLLHLSPESMNRFAELCGPWLYIVLFLIIFAETGLVVTPFLPGDSLLFIVGTLAMTPGSPVGFTSTAVLLIIAAVVGDAVNYWLGARIGPKVFSREDSWLLNKKHLMEAHRFYEKHGGKTIIIARFVPIIRTFAPFVAGIGKMSYPRFAMYNVSGALVWVLSFMLLGAWFGSQPWVQNNFKLVIIAIIVISVLPAVIHAIQARKRANAEQEVGAQR